MLSFPIDSVNKETDAKIFGGNPDYIIDLLLYLDVITSCGQSMSPKIYNSINFDPIKKLLGHFNQISR